MRLGALGTFSKGRLDHTDEGDLMLAVSVHKGVVRLDFGKPVAWLGLDPATARALAASLIRNAEEAEKAS